MTHSAPYFLDDLDPTRPAIERDLRLAIWLRIVARLNDGEVMATSSVTVRAPGG